MRCLLEHLPVQISRPLSSCHPPRRITVKRSVLPRSQGPCICSDRVPRTEFTKPTPPPLEVAGSNDQKRNLVRLATAYRPPRRDLVTGSRFCARLVRGLQLLAVHRQTADPPARMSIAAPISS